MHDSLKEIDTLTKSSMPITNTMTAVGSRPAGARQIRKAPRADGIAAAYIRMWRRPSGVRRRSDHQPIMRRRAEWFEKLELFMALWWAPIGHTPSVEEGMARIETLRRLGPSAEAFTFRTIFPPPDADEAPAPVLDECA